MQFLLYLRDKTIYPNTLQVINDAMIALNNLSLDLNILENKHLYWQKKVED